jgi:hypothetical protein
MLVDSGETDLEILKPRMTEEFATQLRVFRAAQDRDYRPFQSKVDAKELTDAIGRYLISAGVGQGSDKEDFVVEMSSRFAKWPREIVLEALGYANQACPWPRDLPGWMGEIVNKKMRPAFRHRDQANLLLEIWDNK